MNASGRSSIEAWLGGMTDRIFATNTGDTEDILKHTKFALAGQDNFFHNVSDV
jgi:hypothetical protein